MEKSKWYIVRAPQDFSPTVSSPYTNGKFIGVANNGLITLPLPIGLSDMNLIGNPYPSAIDLYLFLTNSNNTNLIEGTVDLWTRNSAPSTYSLTASLLPMTFLKAIRRC